MKKNSRRAAYFASQLPIDFLDTTIVQNAWETVDSDLSEEAPCKIFYCKVEQTNNGATAETLEIEITINGTAYTLSWNANSGTPYFVYITDYLTAGDFVLAITPTPIQFGEAGANSGFDDRVRAFVAKKVGLIRVRQTTGVDPTAAQIEVNIVWDKQIGG